MKSQSLNKDEKNRIYYNFSSFELINLMNEKYILS